MEKLKKVFKKLCIIGYRHSFDIPEFYRALPQVSVKYLPSFDEFFFKCYLRKDVTQLYGLKTITATQIVLRSVKNLKL